MNAQARMTALALLLLVADVRLAFEQAQLPLARNEIAFYIATHGEVRPPVVR